MKRKQLLRNCCYCRANLLAKLRVEEIKEASSVWGGASKAIRCISGFQFQFQFQFSLQLWLCQLISQPVADISAGKLNLCFAWSSLVIQPLASSYSTFRSSLRLPTLLIEIEQVVIGQLLDMLYLCYCCCFNIHNTRTQEATYSRLVFYRLLKERQMKREITMKGVIFISSCPVPNISSSNKRFRKLDR